MAESEQDLTEDVPGGDAEVLSEDPQELLKNVDQEEEMQPDRSPPVEIQFTSGPENAPENDSISAPEDTEELTSNNLIINESTVNEASQGDELQDGGLESISDAGQSLLPSADGETHPVQGKMHVNDIGEQLKTEEQIDQVQANVSAPTPAGTRLPTAPISCSEIDSTSTSWNTGKDGQGTDGQMRIISAPARLRPDPAFCVPSALITDMCSCIDPMSLLESSMVETSVCDTVFEENSYIKQNSLNLVWSFGINRDTPVHALHIDNRRLILYASSHTAVMNNFSITRQHLLQGHCSPLSCIAVSGNRRWVATADQSSESLVIVWDTFSGIPVQTLFDCHPEGGVGAMAMTQDAKYLATVGTGTVQRVCIWDWTSEAKGPACSVDLSPVFSLQTFVLFNPEDNTELLSNSKTEVVFYTWKNNQLEFASPILTDETFNKIVGLYSQSVFHLTPSQVLSATSAGNLVIWDTVRTPQIQFDAAKSYKKKALKLMNVQNDSITVVTVSDRYIVTCDVKGCIKFYDEQLCLLNWYSNFNLGPISSISFSSQPAVKANEKTSYPSESTINAPQLIVRNFVVATVDATVAHVTGDGCKLEVLLQEHGAAVHAIACNPARPLICMGSYCGLLKVWDYEKKEPLCSRLFGKGNYIQCVTYNKTGTLLGVGLTDGCVHILDALSLNDEFPEPFQYARDAVTQIAFSHDSNYLATIDSKTTLTVFMFKEKSWHYLGRQNAHFKPIQNLMFGIYLDSNQPRLLSLGEDRVLVEYDLAHSSQDDLKILSNERIEQSAVPACMAWYPPISKESFIITANNQYKLKLYNATTKMCRKTVLGPIYGSPVRKIEVLPFSNDSEVKKCYLAYITDNKVGLQTLPLDGNPHKSCAVICHGTMVSNIACSYDGSYIFTAGGDDCTVHMWKVDLMAHETVTTLGGEDLIPFYGLLDGGRDGELFKEMENYFYYSQLRFQHVSTMEPREVSTHIPIQEIPFVMRALGFYPTEKEIENILNEVKFSKYVDTGKYVTHIDLGEFIKLYINHRPAFGITASQLQHTFDVLGYDNENGEKAINLGELLQLLQNGGECMAEEEVAECLSTLLGLNPEGGSSELISFDTTNASALLAQQLPQEITSKLFINEILGFPQTSTCAEEMTISAAAST
ncbi:cilia- and flagella-associated protein 251 [Scyliorhinus canicula]|uniref:cilia- and flagella-associated protein 251 n=1 Tax=Scyliorhinus canicula TaxID=7830 RepID=UPI0018F57EA1|nr:cilia- and flagella-associated protein 251 [Scyliorhinus canicula]